MGEGVDRWVYSFLFFLSFHISTYHFLPSTSLTFISPFFIVSKFISFHEEKKKLSPELERLPTGGEQEHDLNLNKKEKVSKQSPSASECDSDRFDRFTSAEQDGYIKGKSRQSRAVCCEGHQRKMPPEQGCLLWRISKKNAAKAALPVVKVGKL